MDTTNNEAGVSGGRILCVTAFAVCCGLVFVLLKFWRLGELSTAGYFVSLGVLVAGGIASVVMEVNLREGRDDRHRGRGFDVLMKKDADEKP